MTAYDMTILTDIDGVVLYWVRSFDAWMKTEKGHEKVDESSYSISANYNISKDQSSYLVNEFNNHLITNLAPVRDSIKYVKKLHEEHGYVFHGISAVANSERVKTMRRQNLDAIYGPTVFEEIILTDNSENKIDVLKRYEGSGAYWIEDLPESACYGLEFGLKPILFSWPYNQKFDHRAAGIKRASSWKRIYDEITGTSADI